jgi:uncharacterized damage-inducible protein DinB
MKKFITEYAAFNTWANERLCEVAAKLNDEQMNQEINSSFSSIKKTLLHIWDAQLIWIKRLEGVSLSSFPSQSFTGSDADLIAGILETSKQLQALAESFDEDALNMVRKYSTLKGGIVTSATYQVLSHVINHSTYHRGQLVTMLRQAGVTEIPSTDLIYFYRERK